MSTTNGRLKKDELENVNAELQRISQHQDAGRLTEAGDAVDHLLTKHEGHPRLLHLKALNLTLSGQRDEGRELLGTVVSQDPDNAPALVDYGSILAQDGDVKTALEYFQMAVETAPNYPLGHANLGAALVLDEQYAKAIQHLEKALELDRQVIDIHTNLAQAYIRTRNFDKAIDVLYQALSVDPQSVSAHINMSAALFRRERLEPAEHHARRAIELAPNSGEAWLHLGNTLAAVGRMDEAAEALQKSCNLPPTGVVALTRLINLRKTSTDSPEFKRLEKLITRIEDMPHGQQASLHFAAGKAHDDIGDYESAFDHFQSGNKISKGLHAFDLNLHETRASRLRELVTKALTDRCGDKGLSDIAPIFICGMPRSGTTLMDQMFSRHPDVQSGGELTASIGAMQKNQRIRDALEDKLPAQELTADDFSRLGEDYAAGVRAEGLRSEYVSDKMPSNHLYIGLLSMALPRAKFLIMRRHPLDCLLSNYMQHFGQNQPFSSDFDHLGAVYTQFDLMAKHWTSLYPDRVRELAYEDVVQDPEGQMRSVMEYVGLDWNDAVLDHTSSMRHVNTASVAQVRQPIYQSAVERWRRYGPLLHELAEAVRDYLTEEELSVFSGH